MQIVAETAHAILAFVDACNRNHYQPEAYEVQAWLRSPLWRDAVYATRRPENAAGGSRLASSARRGYLSILLHAASIAGRPDSAIDEVLEVGWLMVSSDGIKSNPPRLQITSLGRALLREAEIGESDDEQVSVVVLERDDVLAYPKLVGRLAALGDGLLVDPYLRLEHLHHLVISTQLTRLLVGKPKPQDRRRREDLASMGIYLGSRDLARKMRFAHRRPCTTA